MSCDQLYNLYKSSGNKQHYTDWMACRQQQQSSADADKAAARAFYSKQAETAASFARGEHLKDLSTPTDIPGSSFVLPSVQQQTTGGRGANTGLILAGILGGGFIFMMAIFMMMKPKRGGRSYGGYQPYYPGPRKKKKRKKKRK